LRHLAEQCCQSRTVICGVQHVIGGLCLRRQRCNILGQLAPQLLERIQASMWTRSALEHRLIEIAPVQEIDGIAHLIL
jgi:hypothetical protein